MLNQKLIDFIFDFETGSAAPIKTVGAIKYGLHPSTGVTFISYCFSQHDRMKEWSPFTGQPIPEELVDVANNPHKYRFIAHNIEFDYIIWSQVFSKFFASFVRPALQNLHDNMAVSNYFRLGSSLEGNAGMLGIRLRKHEAGRKVMMKLSKPDKFGKRVIPTKEEYKDFAIYGSGDTEILRQCYYKQPELPSFERWIWEWTFKLNMTGIKVDVPLLRVLKSIVDAQRPGLEKKFFDIVGASPGSHVKVKAFFKQYYTYIEDTRKDTIEEMMSDDTPVPSFVREALEIKYLVGGSAISKVDKAFDLLIGDRIYGLFDYAKAQTKRFAGKGIQPQNFPRFDDNRKDDTSKIDFNCSSEELLAQIVPMIPHLTDPMGFVKNLLRRIWLPDDGYLFASGDFSKIEPTMLFWLLDMGPIPDKWYEELAAALFNKELKDIGKDSEERQIGKGGQLSCGYGAGAKSFRVKLFQDTGIMLSQEMAEKVVSTYRGKYPQVVQFWEDLENAYRAALKGFVTKLCRGRITVMPMPGGSWNGVMIVLPDGAKLYYHGAGEAMVPFKRSFYVIENGRKVKKEEEGSKLSLYYLEVDSNGNTYKKTVYSGLLCENVVSATARQVMVPAMKRLEDAGFPIKGTVHDELWGFIKSMDQVKEFERVMSISPEWCRDLIIKTEVKAGVRYLK